MSGYPPRITDAERRTWQRRALAVLDELLTIGAAQKLSTLSWSLDPLGDLVGAVFSRYDVPENQRREVAYRDWQRWTTAIEAAPRQVAGHTDCDYLAAETIRDRVVRVVISAYLPERPKVLDDATSEVP